MVVAIFLQACVLVGTGFLVAALARQTITWKVSLGNRQFDISQGAAAVAFVVGFILEFSCGSSSRTTSGWCS